MKTPEGLAFAREVFERARPGYHPITTASVEAVLAKAGAIAAASASASAPAPAQPEQAQPEQAQPEQAPQH